MVVESALTNSLVIGIPKVVKSVACMVGKQAVERAAKDTLDKILKSAIQGSLASPSILEQVILGLNLSEDESVDLTNFLASQTFQSFIRAMGLFSGANLKAPSEQTASLEAFLQKALPGKSRASLNAFSLEVLNVIEESASDAWKTAVELGVIGKSWSSESIIQTLVSDQVSNSYRQLEQKIAASSASLHDVDNFSQRYKRATILATSKIRPQSINDAPAVQVDELYVEPMVSYSSEKGTNTCNRDMLFAASARAVLLGNPGGGKSTLASKLCHDVCAAQIDSSYFEVPELATQIVVRDYAQFQKTKPCSIVEYLELHSKSAFQIEAPPNAFKLLLLSGRILVVFDGLDELIDIKDRSVVCSAVQHFALEYPIATILVTSREVGYEQAPLDRERFSHYKLSPFDDKQVASYADKWFSYSCSPNFQEGKRLAEAFLEESSIVLDIRSNPLMLGLLCNLYRQDGFIPSNRPEVYQRCADLLFTRWDRSRGISTKIPLDHRLRPTMSFLAHWIYSDDQLQGGVTEALLVAKTTSYLRQWVEDDAEAESIAREFISHFRGRAWVFTDTGSNKTQSLYQFTHRTFLEYFTADELVRTNPRAEDLHNYLSPKIKSRSWDVVCQLAYQLTEQRTQSHDILVQMLCRDASSEPLAEKLNMLSFLARTMDFLYPTPPARRAVVRLCIETVFGNISTIDRGGDPQTALATEILYGVFNPPKESIKINASEIASALKDLITSPSVPSEILADAVVLSSDLTLLTEDSRSRLRSQGEKGFWTEQSEALHGEIRETVSQLASTDPRVAILSWGRMERSLSEIIPVFNTSIVFYSLRYGIIPVFRWPIINILVLQVLRGMRLPEGEEPYYSRERLQWAAIEIKVLLPHLLNDPELKKHTNDSPGSTFFDPVFDVEMILRDGDLAWPEDRSLAECLLVCLACCVEMQQTRAEIPRDKDPTGTLKDISTFCLSKTHPDLAPRAHDIIEARCESATIKALLHGWIDQRTSLLASPADENSEGLAGKRDSK